MKSPTPTEREQQRPNMGDLVLLSELTFSSPTLSRIEPMSPGMSAQARSERLVEILDEALRIANDCFSDDEDIDFGPRCSNQQEQ